MNVHAILYRVLPVCLLGSGDRPPEVRAMAVSGCLLEPSIASRQIIMRNFAA